MTRSHLASIALGLLSPLAAVFTAAICHWIVARADRERREGKVFIRSVVQPIRAGGVLGVLLAGADITFSLSGHTIVQAVWGFVLAMALLGAFEQSRQSFQFDGPWLLERRSIWPRILRKAHIPTQVTPALAPSFSEYREFKWWVLRDGVRWFDPSDFPDGTRLVAEILARRDPPEEMPEALRMEIERSAPDHDPLVPIILLSVANACMTAIACDRFLR